MNRAFEQAMEQARRAVDGLPHGEREGKALEIASAVAGEPVGFLTCNRAGLTGWIERPEPGDPLSENEAAELKEKTAAALRGALDPSGEKRLLYLFDRSEAARTGAPVSRHGDKRKDAPVVAMSAAERESVRHLGHNPDLIDRMDEVKDFSDYKRLKAEIEGGAK